MAIKTTPFDAAEYLTNPEAIAAYLNDAIASGEAEDLIAALGTVARVKGMSVIARDTGLGRESLYKALSGSSNPAFATISRVMASLGLRMAVRPARRSKRPQARRKGASAVSASSPRSRSTA
jgi:probable addiction module antidote protein